MATYVYHIVNFVNYLQRFKESVFYKRLFEILHNM